MSDRLMQAMREAVTETIENMIFMEVTASGAEDWFRLSDDIVSVNLLIHDPIQCELRLLMQKELLMNIAGVVFALHEEELSEQIVSDILAELLNTLAGRFLYHFLPAGQTFKLGLPELDMSGVYNRDEPLQEWYFSIDEQLFALLLYGDVDL